MKKAVIGSMLSIAFLAGTTPVLAHNDNGKFLALTAKFETQMNSMQLKMDKKWEQFREKFDKKIEKFQEKSGVRATTTVRYATTTPQNKPQRHFPSVLSISEKGLAHLQGVVTGVSNAALTVQSWGGWWTVNVGSTTKIASINKVISDIVVGDRVSVKGTTSTSTNLTVTASSIVELQ